MPRRTRAIDQSQLAFDETLINDSTLESALEERQSAMVDLGEARKVAKEKHAAAKVEIEKLELPDDKAVRVGRFRITRSSVAARHVEFDTDPTSRVKITLLEAGEGEDLDDVAGEVPAGPPSKDDPAVIDLANAAARARSGSDEPTSLRNRVVTP